MIFDEHGLPRDNGATDFADSARLAGLMALVGHKDMTRNKLLMYSINNGFDAVRYPFIDVAQGISWSNNPKNFTRDQLICLVAGLKKLDCPVPCIRLLASAETRKSRAQNIEDDVPGSVKKFPNGADILTPSHMNHLRICAGEKPTLLGKAWLMMDIIGSSIFTPMHEPNQLIAMCLTAGPFYVKMLRKMNKKLDEAIKEYWCGWRNEPELAQMLIDVTKQ